MRFAALEEGSPQAGFAGLLRDTGLQEAGALGALVLDCRRRPADKLAVVFSGPVAAVRVRRRRAGRVSETALRSDAVRPDAVQQLGRGPEVLAPGPPHHDSKHRRDLSSSSEDIPERWPTPMHLLVAAALLILQARRHPPSVVGWIVKSGNAISPRPVLGLA